MSEFSYQGRMYAADWLRGTAVHFVVLVHVMGTLDMITE